VTVSVVQEGGPPKDLILDVLLIVRNNDDFVLLGVYLDEVGPRERKQGISDVSRLWSLLRYETVRKQLQADCMPVSSTTISPACVTRLAGERGRRAPDERFISIPKSYFRRKPGDTFEWGDRRPLIGEVLYETRRFQQCASDEQSKLWEVTDKATATSKYATGWLRADASDLLTVNAPQQGEKGSRIDALVGCTFEHRISSGKTQQATVVGVKPSRGAKGPPVYIAEFPDGTRAEVNDTEALRDRLRAPRFRKWLGRRIAKSFKVNDRVDGGTKDEVYIGDVQQEVRFLRSRTGAFLEPLLRVVYGDGDAEDMEVGEVEQRLIPVSNNSVRESQAL